MPKRSLGQVFLVDKNIQRKIINFCGFVSEDYILEIGAGRGELSQLIAETGAKLFALEIDDVLFKELKYRLNLFKNVKLIKRDILKFNIRRYFNNITDKKIRVIGNIPYYITTSIILHLIKYRDKIQDIFLTVQKEFARRITSTAGSSSYGAISCYIQYYTEPQILFYIKNRSFWPNPQIDSCFLRFKFKENYPLSINEEKKLFKIIRTAFSQRRKALKNSLKKIVPSYKLEEFFRKTNISPQIRPEDLSLKDFISILKI
ncbi:MAG: 16S rRNA (adenine(1518)-N(6)/adenine(1519)-N(6))-dimethyltransferase RsmA [Candidatus Omnitrophica bacterium]|nr:16S rRNA (adenine(1518)-N(6)/adenine(1519)-N(6))-dimethyltransferase RsmA [Candidatus Omnitrophota bacterium]